MKLLVYNKATGIGTNTVFDQLSFRQQSEDTADW